MKLISKVIATFIGAGYFPIAPGTLTSFIIIILYKFFLYKLNWPVYLMFLFLLFLIGVSSSSFYSKQLKKKDPRQIVVDEALGQLLTLFRLNPSWFLLLSAFFLFRLFDIVKPFPIRKSEAFPKGWGIMIDDIVAAFYAGIIINIYLLIK